MAFSSASFAEDSDKNDKNMTQQKSAKTAENDKMLLFAALESALDYNKELSSMRRDLLATHEGYAIASSAFRPHISAGTQYQANSKKHWSSSSKAKDTDSYNTKDHVSSYGVSLSHNIFRGFADMAALNESDCTIKAKWSSYESKKQNVFMNIAVLYFAIISKAQEINHLKALLNCRQSSINVASEMFEAGAAKNVDVLQAKAAHAETEAKLAKSKAEYASYLARFEEATGFILPAKFSVPNKLFDVNMTEEQAMDIAFKMNPIIKSSQAAVDAAKAAIKKANTEFTPSVDVTYSYDQSYDSSMKKHPSTTGKSNVKGHTAGISLKVPIYDGGRARAEKRQLIETAAKAAVEKEKTIQEIKVQICTVWAEMQAAKQNIISAKTAVEARKKALNDTDQEYKAGTKIMNDVLEAQEHVFETEYLLTKAEEEYFKGQCQALYTLGKFDEKCLKLRNSGFDYKALFSKTRRKL